MVVNDILGWYESGLSAQERKVRGHFSTPPLLVERILDACGYTPENDLSRLRILDPACGSGNFLAGALRRLLAFAHRTTLDKAKLDALVQRNLWGFDPDPVACFLAQMQLQAQFSHAGSQMLDASSGRRRRVRPSPRLHIHQADTLTFPWDTTQNVDLLLVNPPYLAAKNTDLSGYRAIWQEGQVDSYLLFLKLALQVVRPGGWLGLVLPDPVLARANATRERQRLLQEMTIHSLWHLSGVFAAYVGAVVIVAQKCPPSSTHSIAWIRGRWQPAVKRNTLLTESVGSVEQSLLARQPASEMRYLLSDVRFPHSALVKRLSDYQQSPPGDYIRCFAPLAELVLIRRGEELSKDSILLSEMLPIEERDDRYPVLRGGVDMRPYVTPAGRCWIACQEVRKPLERYLAPKLLVVKSTGDLQAALDLQRHVVLQTLYTLNLHGGRVEKEDVLDELYFLLALLNSRLLRAYVHMLHTAYKWVQPQIEQHVLAHLPIPTIASPEKASIIARAKALSRACGELPPGVELKEQELYEEQERAICALYDAALLDEHTQKSSLAIQ